MPKKNTQSNEWDFKVRMEPNCLAHVRNADGSPILTGGYSITRNDTNAILGTVSEQYGIVQNGDLIDTARKALDARGLLGAADEKIVTVDNGKRMYATFTFRTGQLTTERAVGDVLGYKIVLQNSFDRSQTASFRLGFERLVCKNGMVALVAEFACNRKHHKKLTLDFLPDALDKAIGAGQTAVGVFHELAETSIEMEQGQIILHNLVKRKIFAERLREKIEDVWLNPPFAEDAERNLYNLYNAVTFVLTRQIENGWLERSNELNFAALNALQRAARAKNELDKLLIPVDDDKKIVIAVNDPAALIAAPAPANP